MEDRLIVNGIDLAPYVQHPRILELRLGMFYSRLSREYTYNDIFELFKALSAAFKCDWQKMHNVLDNIFDIRRIEKTDRLRYRQEAVLLGFFRGKSRWHVGKNYLDIDPALMYKGQYPYAPKEFITQKWLDELDRNVTISGIPQYRREIERFVTGLDALGEAL